LRVARTESLVPAAGVAREGGLREEGDASLSRERVVEIQRSRLLLGAVDAIDEHGYAAVTVAHITGRAKVSKRTFYDLFEDREACLAALVDDVLATLEDELARAGLDGLPWRERVRGGLGTILAFFDREPALARICVVETLHGGPRLLARREATLARLAAVLDEGRGVSRRANDCTALTAEGLVGAAAAILVARLQRRERTPSLLALTGELMGMIVLPYLGSAAARSEQARPAPTAPSPSARAVAAVRGETPRDPLQGLPMRVTYRTARVLEGIAQRPGACNREIADRAGIQDQGQVSKLLARLERLGLTANGGPGHLKGEPNAWTLTALGEQVAGRLGIDGERRGEAGATSPRVGRSLATPPHAQAAERSRGAGRSDAGSRRRQTRRSSR
jgi:AcrR family transcriptional regulator